MRRADINISMAGCPVRPNCVRAAPGPQAQMPMATGSTEPSTAAVGRHRDLRCRQALFRTAPLAQESSHDS